MKNSRDTLSDDLSSHPFAHPRKFHQNTQEIFPSKNTHLTLLHTPNLPYNIVDPPTIIPPSPPILHIIHGLCKATFGGNWITLYSLSIMDPTYGFSPIYSLSYSHPQAPIIDSYPVNSYSLYCITNCSPLGLVQLADHRSDP